MDKPSNLDGREGRDARGRFAKGAKPGPGRPRLPARPAAGGPVGPASTSSEAELRIAAMLTRDVQQAWLHVLEDFPPPVVAELVADCQAHGHHVPAWVFDRAFFPRLIVERAKEGWLAVHRRK